MTNFVHQSISQSVSQLVSQSVSQSVGVSAKLYKAIAAGARIIN
jgi:hypothetical protein